MIDQQTPAEGQTGKTEARVRDLARILSVSDILDTPDLEERDVAVPQWGGSVRIKGFTKARQLELRKQATLPDGAVDTDRLEVFLFIEGVIEPKFTAEHYEQLRQRNATAIDLVLKAITQISGQYPGSEAKGDYSSMDEAGRSFRP